MAGAGGQALRLVVGVSGIYAAFLYYGSLQEDVLRYKAADGTKFTYSWFLQVLEAAANVVLGLVCMLVLEGVRMVPQVPYLISGALQVTAKYCTTASMVAGVSFPVATLAKSSKMVPVMVGSLLLGKAQYTLWEYVRVAMIVGGTALVSMGKKSKGGASTNTGLLFLVAALACDGVVGGTQKGMKKALAAKGMKEKNFEMQFLTNFYMMLTAIVFTAALGEFGPGLEFMKSNPGILKDVVLFSVCSAVGQAFIFFTISTFDPLVCTTVTTTRKVFSVLLSIFTKGHQLDPQGWSGIALACSGILGELGAKVMSSGASNGKKDGKKKQ
jgi:UDP-galactose transporter B1